MKRLAGILWLFFVCTTLLSQSLQPQTKTDPNGYQYKTVDGDPLNARIYTLDNGLKVYLTDYKDEPRIQTYVAVRAGSKHDPKEHTGLAHYLEHMLFKGTSEIGANEWEKEQDLLLEIEDLYEVYGETTDKKKRKEIYGEIDSLSGVAGSYAIANEYDKLMSSIGAEGTNAYTFFEQTVYVNDIPANQLEKWAAIEAERFSELVPRLFHTELETVYEEKNKGIDSDSRQVWETMLETLFEEHQYGTQTTIGTIEHLKSPSIKAIKEYFNKYYVPENMAVCLSGDLDMEATIQIIDRTFGELEPGEKEPEGFDVAKEAPIAAPREKTVKGPDAEAVSVAYRLPGYDTRESLLMEMMTMILSNGQAGLIDINLNQRQKLLGAYNYPLRLKDYSLHVLGAKPKSGQTLQEARDLLLEQIEIVKEGDFDDWLLEAVVNDYKLSQIKDFEKNSKRADAFVTAFIMHVPWEDYVAKVSEMETVTKQEIVDFANKYYDDNYVTVFKETGEDSGKVKVEKPDITPVSVNRFDQSDFFKQITSDTTAPLTPEFIDFDKAIDRFSLKNGEEVLYRKNTENDLFELYYVFDLGKDHNKKLSLAVEYLNYIGSQKYNSEALQKEFFKIGCQFDVMTDRDELYVSLNGLTENFDQGMKLFENFLRNPEPDDEALQQFVSRTLKKREDKKLSKRTILTKGLASYAKYGEVSPFTDILSEEELKNIEAKELVDLIRSLYQYPHRALYYGPLEKTNLLKTVNKHHKTKKKKAELPEPTEYTELPLDKSSVLFADYDMVQSETVFLSRSIEYDKGIVPEAKLFNEYFGGSMSSIVFQELRESRALAYSVYAYYSTASKPDKPNYIVSYIGSQADKLIEAVEGMEELFNEMPHSASSFTNAREGVLHSLRTQRITKSDILFSYEKARKLGWEKDPREAVYNYVLDADYESIQNFYEEYVQNKEKVVLIIGDKDALPLDTLREKYVDVKELSLEELFGY